MIRFDSQIFRAALLGSCLFVAVFALNSIDALAHPQETTTHDQNLGTACQKPGVKIKCLDLQPENASNVSVLLKGKEIDVFQSMESKSKTILRNTEKFQNFSLGQSFTLNYSMKAQAHGNYTVECHTSPSLIILSQQNYKISVADTAKELNYQFQLRPPEKGDYCIILSVRPEDDTNSFNSGGNAVLYFRYDEQGGRLLDARAILLEDKLKIWREHYNSDPGRLNDLPEAVIINRAAGEISRSEFYESEKKGIVRANIVNELIKVSGVISYLDYNGSYKPLRNATVEVIDEDGFTSDQVLATVGTDDNGYYSAYVEKDKDSVWPQTGTSDIFINVIAKTFDDGRGEFIVQDEFLGFLCVSGDDYEGESGITPDVEGDLEKNLNLGTLGKDSNVNKAFTIFDHVFESQRFFTFYGNQLIGGRPEKLTATYPLPNCIDWIPGVDMSFFNGFVGGPRIYYNEEDIVSAYDEIPSVIWHEYGHFVMWNLFGQSYPCGPKSDIVVCCTWLQHNIGGTTPCRELAWTEGWADFVAVATRDKILNLQDGEYWHANGGVSRLATLGNSISPVTEIDNVEGRVAGSLYDLFDEADDENETYDNAAGSRNHDKLLRTMQSYGQVNLFEHLIVNYMLQHGSRWIVLGACLQNGIDYGADHTAPSVTGTPLDGGEITTTPSVSFSWIPAFDGESGLSGYHLQIGSAPGNNDILDGLIGNAASYTFAAMDGQVLFARVRAQNEAGMFGEWSPSSDGIAIYITPPQVSATRPAFNSDNGDRTTNITLTLDKALLPSLYNERSFHVDAEKTGLHFGTLELGWDKRSIIFDPFDDFLVGEKVSVTVTPVVGLKQPYTFSFMVAPSAGTGNFTEIFGASPYIVGKRTRNPVTADFDGDGYFDLAVPDGASSQVIFYKGGQDSTFATPNMVIEVGGLPNNLTAGDLNRDGKMDLIICARDLALSPPGVVSILFGNGDGSFQNPTKILVGEEPQTVLTGDFNGDGRMDLVANRLNDSTLTVILSTGASVFEIDSTYNIAGFARTFVSGDFNNDGLLDLAAASGDNTPGSFEFGRGVGTLLLGSGDGTFSIRKSFDPGQGPFHMATGDFNHDEALDLVVANEDDNGETFSRVVTVLLGQGNGEFSSPQKIRVDEEYSEPRAVAVGDFIKDGHLDLAVATISPGEVSILQGDGAGNFSLPVAKFRVGDAANALVTSDFNNDGIIDLASSNYGSDTALGTLTVLFGDIGLTKRIPTMANTERPTEFALKQNSPNPFNPSTVIEYGLPQSSNVTLKIYNAYGQEVRILIDGFEMAGYKSAIWDGKNNRGESVPSGIYFYRITASYFEQTLRMLLLK